jgi:secreted trypsin-like serine protease
MRGLGSSLSRWPAGAACLCALLATALAPAAVQASAPAQASIVGGGIAQIADFPSLAFIQAGNKQNGGFQCTGTVISPRVILTAAHCVEDLDAGGLTPAGEYVVATGFLDPHQAKPADLLRVASTHVFPGFDPGIVRGDAGILILATPTTAPPIPLATTADAALYEGGAGVLVAGWGLRRAEATAEPSRLRTASTLVQEAPFCKRKTQSYDATYSTADQMCTLDSPAHKVGDCFGDSGGPAIAARADGSPVEIGIASVVAAGCSTTLPNIFTRADLVSTWASEWVAATESGAPSPELNGPQAQLPKLTRAGAARLALGTLTHAFGELFTDSSETRGNCQSVARARAKCNVAWRLGSVVFFGTVAIGYVLQRNSVVVENHYKISRIPYACIVVGSHRQDCPVHTRSG